MVNVESQNFAPLRDFIFLVALPNLRGKMTTVEQAEQMILAQARDYGTEQVPFDKGMGRVLAEAIVCDRDLPAYDRVSMDGIAISYTAFADGLKVFRIKATQAAGDIPIEIDTPDKCIEIMTGAALPPSTDTIVRYEDLLIQHGTATIIIENIRKGQNIHYRGVDRKQNELVAPAGVYIGADIVSIAATVGKTELTVKKLPRVVVISTGDELVEVAATPSPYQIRRSNNHTLKAALEAFAIDAAMLHLPDEPAAIEEKITLCLETYDVLLLSGGISMGKYDHLPKALEKTGVRQLFHKVEQRPGKPFWFGVDKAGVLVFAFPGNPVSSFMCLHRYFIPWLQHSLGVAETNITYALLTEDVAFTPALQYFMQVKLSCNERGQLTATPIQGNGSGDLANLIDSNAFLELPLAVTHFKKGAIYRAWPFKKVVGF